MAVITDQGGVGKYLTQQLIGCRVHYWPQLREGDPDVVYDVQAVHVRGEDCIGRYDTLARAEEVRDAVIAAMDANQNYQVPET